MSKSPSYSTLTRGFLKPILRPPSQGDQQSQRRASRSPSPHHRVHLQPVVEAPRERPEAVFGRVVSPYRGVQVVGVLLGPRLVSLLQGESCPRRENGSSMRGGEALVEDQRLGGAAGMATASPPLISSTRESSPSSLRAEATTFAPSSRTGGSSHSLSRWRPHQSNHLLPYRLDYYYNHPFFCVSAVLRTYQPHLC